MRLFVSLQLEDDLRAELVRAQSILERRFNDGIRYMTPEQLHLTLRFLGEVDETQRIAVSEELQAISTSISPFEVALEGLGCFPEEDRASVRIIWAGLKTVISGQGSPLSELAQRCEAAMRTLGFEAEDRVFKPHVTIARVKYDKSRGHLREAVDVLMLKPASQPVKSFALTKSVTGHNGSIYENLELYDLARFSN